MNFEVEELAEVAKYVRERQLRGKVQNVPGFLIKTLENGWQNLTGEKVEKRKAAASSAKAADEMRDFLADQKRKEEEKKKRKKLLDDWINNNPVKFDKLVVKRMEENGPGLNKAQEKNLATIQTRFFVFEEFISKK